MDGMKQAQLDEDLTADAERVSSESLCVMDRHGLWCVAVGQPEATATSVQTQCGEFIVLPHGIEPRNPTCPKCLETSTTAKEAYNGDN